jgi:hypothetical protein
MMPMAEQEVAAMSRFAFAGTCQYQFEWASEFVGISNHSFLWPFSWFRGKEAKAIVFA